jgi:predicted AAA+ superfamily ATPase
MWIERNFTENLREAASRRPALVLTGPRQTGKTSLLRNLFPKHQYVSLDSHADAALAEQDPQAFLARFGTPLIIDEVQNAPGLFRSLKMLIDSRRDEKGFLILTGSQKFQLMKEVSDSLAGRVALFELEPLSWAEIHGAKPETRYEDVLLRGGYPELTRDPGISAGEYYRSYVSTYLERDVRNLVQVGELRDFDRFLRVCALRSAQLLNKAELARDVGVSPTTANRWLSVLEASNILFLLEPWFANGSKSIVKTPKLYLNDTGLLCHLLDIETPAELLKARPLGAIWETFVFAELRKQQSAQRGHWSAYFWRDRAKEVDFLVHRGGRFALFEAKWSATPSLDDAVQLRACAAQLGAENVERQAVVCRAEHAYPLATGIEVVPVGSMNPLR